MPEKLSLTVDRNLAIPMTDGTILYADLYRPAGPGPFPTLLQRTPYEKAFRGPTPSVLRFASAGYAVVVQDVRGRYESEGEFFAFVNERADGLDTIEWLVNQPWCDGNIGMFGGSYVGLTQWQAALNNHPALKAIVPVVTAANYHDGWTYQGGAFELQFNLSWLLTALASNTAIRKHGMYSDQHEAFLTMADAMPQEFERLPLKYSSLISEFADYYDTWVDHPTYDEFWSTLDVSANREGMSVASLNIGGWYDVFQDGTIQNFVEMQAQSGNSNLLMGPWNHGGMANGNPIGSFDFGTRSTGGYLDSDGLHLRWYDRWLRDEDNGVDSEPPVRLFVMGSNQWRSEESWPLEGTEWQQWFFHSGGRANSAEGDGTLSRDAPVSEPPDSFVYNPRNPVPTHGGGLCCNNVYSLGGVQDQRPIESREDVLVYSSPPLEQPLEVTGPVTVTLYASSSATDTDFTAKLVDVAPCGYARNLTDGIIRARFRNSMSTPELIEPGEVLKYEIDIWSTSNMFLPGHQIRVEVSSSNFPRFDRNPNTGELPGRSEVMVSALQNIHHNQEYPSHITLPVVQR